MKIIFLHTRGIAASAPIAQFTGLTDCGQFGKIVTADFEKESTECVESIRKSWAYINALGDTGEIELKDILGIAFVKSFC